MLWFQLLEKSSLHNICPQLPIFMLRCARTLVSSSMIRSRRFSAMDWSLWLARFIIVIPPLLYRGKCSFSLNATLLSRLFVRRSTSNDSDHSLKLRGHHYLFLPIWVACTNSSNRMNKRTVPALILYCTAVSLGDGNEAGSLSANCGWGSKGANILEPLSEEDSLPKDQTLEPKVWSWSGPIFILSNIHTIAASFSFFPEPVFGQIQHARGLRQSSLRGM